MSWTDHNIKANKLDLIDDIAFLANTTLSCYAASTDFPNSLSLSLSLSLAIRLYHPLLPTGLQDYILRLKKVIVDKFLLVDQHLHVCVKGSTGERPLWVGLYFSSSVLHILLVLFG